MVISTVNDLVDALRYERLLNPKDLEQLNAEFLRQFPTPQALAKQLIQMGWVTVYQINHLFEGRAGDLVIGPYCLMDLLGEGGVGSVFRAWDTEKKRLVALKVLRQDLNASNSAIQQFEQERNAVTRLSHPNVINTYDAGNVGDSYFFAMELVEGTDLGKVIQLSGPMLVGEATDCIRQVASGLQHAHQLGLVHRDIKPANLFLIHPPGYDKPRPGVAWRRPKDVAIKILDWGLAKLTGEGEAPNPEGARSEEGMLIGTADYVAPEQARNPVLVDIRADIYSLGCTFYYLLAGKPPFAGKTAMQKILQHQNEEPPRIDVERPDVPKELADMIHKMMAKDPDDRYQIPLAVTLPLRRFSASASSYNGLSLRSSSNGTTMRPTSAGTSVRGSGLTPRYRPTSNGSSPQTGS